jgi:RNA polymerase sigma-70 factor (ECF subfamily)
VVGRSAAAVRQLASRARRHVRDERPRFPPSPRQQAELLDAFTSACADGDLDRLLALLDPGVVWRADGGGKDAGRITAIDVIRDPDKLTGVRGFDDEQE